MSKVTLSRQGMSRKGKRELAKALNLTWNTESYAELLRSKSHENFNKTIQKLLRSIVAASQYYNSTTEAIFESISPVLITSSILVLQELNSYTPDFSTSTLDYAYDDTILDQLILRTIDTELAFTKHEAACVQYEHAVAFRKALDQVGLLKIRGSKS